MDITEVQKVELKENEYLFIKVPHIVSKEMAGDSRENLRPMMGDDADRCIFINSEVDLTKVCIDPQTGEIKK